MSLITKGSGEQPPNVAGDDGIGGGNCVENTCGISATECCRLGVPLGALAKGRSSSPALLRLCRQAAAISLGFGMRLYLRYVPSEWNIADGPSRGLGVGAAEETQHAHADRARARKTPEAKPLPQLSDARLLAELLKMGRSGRGAAGG